MIFRDLPVLQYLEKRRKTRTSIRRFHFGRLRQMVLGFLPLIPLVLPALAQENENTGALIIIETISKPAPIIYEPNDRRDPFLNLVPPKITSKKVEDVEIPRGTPPPGIEGTFIDKAGLEGIIIRSNDQRMAIVRSEDNRAYFLREGDHLFDGYLKTIDDDFVVFVRETFMRSGKVRTQEVTKRLREL